MITLANDIEKIFTLGNDAASALTLFRDAWFSRVRAGINSSGGGDHVIIIIVGDNRAIMISLDIHTHKHRISHNTFTLSTTLYLCWIIITLSSSSRGHLKQQQRLELVASLTAQYLQSVWTSSIVPATVVFPTKEPGSHSI